MPTQHDSSVVIGAVILGAGFSRRFGADKRLQPLLNSTVAEVTVGLYTQAFEQVRVVLRDDDDELREKLNGTGAQIISCDDAHLGMGHSLAAGFAGLEWQWAFVGLLDMPFLQPETLHQLIRTARQQQSRAIIRPRLRNPGADGTSYGHPIGWHATYFEEIQRCQGDTGARQLLRKYADDILEIELGDPGILQDIDTPADLEAYKSSVS